MRGSFDTLELELFFMSIFKFYLFCIIAIRAVFRKAIVLRRSSYLSLKEAVHPDSLPSKGSFFLSNNTPKQASIQKSNQAPGQSAEFQHGIWDSQ